MKQNITLSLDQRTIRKAQVIAARQGTSISGLLAEKIEEIVGEDEAYERAKREAMRLLEQGFHLGGAVPPPNDALAFSRAAAAVRAV
jgi:hypothetical protein